MNPSLKPSGNEDSLDAQNSVPKGAVQGTQGSTVNPQGITESMNVHDSGQKTLPQGTEQGQLQGMGVNAGNGGDGGGECREGSREQMRVVRDNPREDAEDKMAGELVRRARSQ